jgi:hypothetical protein
MKVLAGRVRFSVDGKEVILTPSHPPYEIRRMHVHGFKFFPGEPATLLERTDPTGDFKEEFFRDVFEDGQPKFWTTVRAAYDGDTYLSLGPQWLDVAVVSVLGRFAKWWVPRKRSEPATDSAGSTGTEERAWS